MDKYDVAVIGGGPGGYVTVIGAAHLTVIGSESPR